MALSITTIAPTSSLTTVARVRAAGLAFPSSDDAEIERIIRAASAAIVSYCGRPFGREVISETARGFGDITLVLTRTPIVSVSSVVIDSSVYTDYSIGDADRGELYRRGGWGWTVQTYLGLSAQSYVTDGRLFSLGTPLPQQEEPAITVVYTAGYVLPPQHRTDVTTLSASAADNSFNDSASGFPALLKAGDVIEALGFTDGANNGRFLVTGTPTASKIVVSATLATEAAGAARTILFHPPAQCRPFDDVERAAFECVKSWYTGRGRDSAVVERQIASTRVRFSETENARLLGLPAACVGLLRAWKRTA